MGSPELSPLDDGLTALQLPFLQSDEVSRFLPASKEWSLAPNDKDYATFDEENGSPVDFFGHYSNPSLNVFFGQGQSSVHQPYGYDGNGGQQQFAGYQSGGVSGIHTPQPIYGQHTAHDIPTPGPILIKQEHPLVPSFSNSQSGNVLNSSVQYRSVDATGRPLAPQLAGQEGPMINQGAQVPLNDNGTFQNLLTSLTRDPPSGSLAPISGSSTPGRELKFYLPSPVPFLMDSPGNQNLTTQLVPQQLQPQPSQNAQLAVPTRAELNAPITSGTDTGGNGQLHQELPSQQDQGKGAIRKHLESVQYLQFLPAERETVLYDSRGNRTEIDLTATLLGNFFLSVPNPVGSGTNALSADTDGVHDSETGHSASPRNVSSSGAVESTSPERSPSGINGSPSGGANKKVKKDPKKDPSSIVESYNIRKYDLTFYRRNLFHVTVTVSNAHNAVYAGNSENPMLRSRILSVSLGVTVSGNDSKIPKTLLYSPPRSSATDRKELPEPAVKFIYPKDSGYDEVVNWKRLQFRSATAHNGRRKLQNYFTVVVSAYAELENAQRVCLVKCCSRPIVVRGRNPRFYQNRDTIIISEGPSRTYFPANAPDDQRRSQDADDGEGAAGSTGASGDIKRSSNDQGPQHTASSASTEKHDVSKLKDEDEYDEEEDGEAESFEPESEYANIPRSAVNSRLPRAEDDDAHSDDGSRYAMKAPAGDEQQSPNTKGSNRDVDYEYFPMPMNYWLPPVEVVYRPHAVHHPMKLPQSGNQQPKNKRYFSAVE